jgi:hypothetical protein
MMSNLFKGFDEAATLYAKNLPLIQEMEKIFDEDMLHLEEVLRPEIEKHVPKRLFKFGGSKKPRDDPRPRPARHICLADDDEGPWKHAFLKMDMRDVSPAASGHLILVADAPHATADQLQRLWKIPEQETLSAFCELRGRQKRSFFEVTAELSNGDSLDNAGKQIAMVLKAMYKAETGRTAK